MQIEVIQAKDAPPPAGAYAQAVLATGATRILHISGQVPETPDRTVPAGFEAQARLVWKNIFAQLAAADMTADNIVKVTTLLTDRALMVENRAIRREMLGERMVASTLIIAGIADEAWMLEIEAVAVA